MLRHQSLGQQMLELGCENATVGKNGLMDRKEIPAFCVVDILVVDLGIRSPKRLPQK